MKAIFVALSIALVAGASFWPGGAAAHDHRIPRVRLISKKAWQRGRLQSFCWVTGNGGTGEACAGGAYSWPVRDKTPGKQRATVRIRKAQPPRRLKITSWRKLGKNQSPSGEGKRVEYKLETTVHNGKIVQEARFRLPRKPGHYYLEVFGVWPDVVTGQRQNATWNMHLKLY